MHSLHNSTRESESLELQAVLHEHWYGLRGRGGQRAASIKTLETWQLDTKCAALDLDPLRAKMEQVAKTGKELRERPASHVSFSRDKRRPFQEVCRGVKHSKGNAT